MQTKEPGDAELTVLLVEDEETFVEFLTMGLTYEGFTVHAVRDGREALPTFERVHPHVVLLDLMLPGMDGISICRALRARSEVPIIMLTARGEVEDRIEGLDSGADDYLPKPFKFAELMARVRAVLRRHKVTVGSTLAVGDLRLDRNTREVTHVEQPIDLTRREFDLLECFMLPPRHVLTRDAILDRVWGYDQVVDTNVVDVYVGYLRAKLGEDGHERIKTVRGVGYRLR